MHKIQVLWSIQILADNQWRQLPGSWETRQEAEAAFLEMMPRLNRRGDAPTDHKIVARVV